MRHVPGDNVGWNTAATQPQSDADGKHCKDVVWHGSFERKNDLMHGSRFKVGGDLGKHL